MGYTVMRMTYAEVAVETRGLTKRYGSTTVLDGVDLRVPRGSVFALLGPNGAGKTTTVRILATLARPDAGTARVAGLDVVRRRRDVRRRISLTGQYAAVDDGQTARENLVMTGRLVGLGRAAARRAAELIERFDLVEAADRRVATYSGGMRRRLDLAVSLLGSPEVIFLDEPTTGLDPRSRRQTWDVVGELAAAGTTIFLTTQYLEEADRLAGRIAVLDGGRVVAEGGAAELKRRVGEQRVDLALAGPAHFDAVLGRLGDRVAHADRAQLVVGVATDGSASHVRGVLDAADPVGDAVATFTLHAATLDDVFLALTGRPTGAGPEGTDDAGATDRATGRREPSNV
jgi:ABC-2 type transport system ATP-binding protein